MKSDLTMEQHPESSNEPGPSHSKGVDQRQRRCMEQDPDFSDEPGPSQPGPSQPGPSQPGPSQSKERKRSTCVQTEELSRCSVCEQYLWDPVSITCGHWFCRQCIISYWDEPITPGKYGCPQCDETFSQRPGLLTLIEISTVQMDISLQVLKTHMISLTKRLEGQREDIAGSGTGASFNRINTTLYITEGQRDWVNKQHEVCQLEKVAKINTSDKPIKCSDIFKPSPGGKKPIRIVLTKGNAGIGKTVAAYNFAMDWAEHKANQHIDLLILMPFRELNLVRNCQYSLLTLIHDFYPTLKEMTAGQLAACVAVFIFDSLDESRIPLDFRNDIVSDVTVTSPVNVLLTNLIKGNLLPSAQLWITTRPEAANQIPSEYVDRVTEVRGFTDPQKVEYFRTKFSDKLASMIISHINSSKSIHIMCHNPLFCWVTAEVLENMLRIDKTGQLPTTPTEMFCHFLVFQTKKNNQKYEEQNCEVDLMGTDGELLLKLGRLAFEQLKKESILFYQADLTECGLDVKEASLYSGLCTVTKRESGVFQNTVYCFVHLSIQEFLAAVYWLHWYTHALLTWKSQMSFLEDDMMKNVMLKALKSENGHWDLFVLFLHGLSLESNQRLLGGLLSGTENSPESTQRVINNLKEMNANNYSSERCIIIFHCLMEMKDDSLMQEIRQYLKSENRSDKELTEIQCSALASILLMSEEVLDELDLGGFNTSPQGQWRLLPAVRNVRKARIVHSYINTPNCQILLSALSSNPSHLLELDLSHDILEEPEMKWLLDGLQSPHCRLQILRLSDCQLTESCCEYLASGLCCQNYGLRELDLSFNDLRDSGVHLLIPGLQNSRCRLEKLRLSDCILSERCCNELAALISSRISCLRELDLSHNGLHDSGVKRLSAGLKSPHCTLDVLRLSHCDISEDGCSFLASALKLSSLKELDLSFNHPGDSVTALNSIGLDTLNLNQEEECCLRPEVLKIQCVLTLDKNTSNKALSLYENNRKVTVMSEVQSYPTHPDRFEYWPQVLCRERLIGLGGYWEVEWSGQVCTAVSYKGIVRNGKGDGSVFGHNDKSWSLECDGIGDRYAVLHDKKKTVLHVRPSGSNRVGLYLNCDAGTLSFYRVSSEAQRHLYTFHTTFTEPLYPGFLMGPDSSVSLSQTALSSGEGNHSNRDRTTSSKSVQTEQTTTSSQSVQTEQTTTSSQSEQAEQRDITYRYDFRSEGMYSLTGLVSKTGKGDIIENIKWDERWLHSTGRTTAEPLLHVMQEATCELALHCDIKADVNMSTMTTMMSMIKAEIEEVREAVISAVKQRCEDHPDAIPSQTNMVSMRESFIAGVSQSVIKGLIDKLLGKVLNDGEMEEIRAEKTRRDQARELIDMVRRKGNDASSELIIALYQEDPTLYKKLGLPKR